VLLGGGIAVGSLVVIEDETSSHIGFDLIRYYLAEGRAVGHKCTLATGEPGRSETFFERDIPLNLSKLREIAQNEAEKSEKDAPSSSSEKEALEEHEQEEDDASQLRVAARYSSFVEASKAKNLKEKNEFERGKRHLDGKVVSGKGSVPCSSYDLSRGENSKLQEKATAALGIRAKDQEHQSSLCLEQTLRLGMLATRNGNDCPNLWEQWRQLLNDQIVSAAALHAVHRPATPNLPLPHRLVIDSLSSPFWCGTQPGLLYSLLLALKGRLTLSQTAALAYLPVGQTSTSACSSISGIRQVADYVVRVMTNGQVRVIKVMGGHGEVHGFWWWERKKRRLVLKPPTADFEDTAGSGSQHQNVAGGGGGGGGGKEKNEAMPPLQRLAQSSETKQMVDF
jgi:elongator complex protein 4